MLSFRHRTCPPLFVVLAAAALNPAACDCEEEPITRVECNFEVSRDEIPFPATAVGGRASVATFTVLNTSVGVALRDFSATFDRNGEHFSVQLPEDGTLAPGDDETVVVEFAPLVDVELAARLVLSHPDVGGVRCPSVEITLRGRGEEQLDLDAGPGDAGPDDAGVTDAGAPYDAGPDEDAGTVEVPDAGAALLPDSEWFAYGALEDARMGFAAVELVDGDVLVVGGTREDGEALDSIERFNPASGVSRVVARMALPRAEPALARLSDGRVVIVGGRSAAVGGFALRTVEVFEPSTNTVSCVAPNPNACVEADDGLLAQGRIGAIATATASNSVLVVLGRTLMDDGEIMVGGGEVITLAPPASAPVAGLDALGPRVDFAYVRSPSDGSLLVVGGRSAGGSVLRDVARISTLTSTVTELPDLDVARQGAAVALLPDGTAMVAGGALGTGAAVPEVELVRDPFGAATVEPTDLLLTPRVGGSLLSLDGGIVLWAGGLPTRAAGDVLDSEVPLTSADVVVPFGADGFLRFSSDNDLAHGRVGHVALVVGSARSTALFLGGSATAPRRSPHPHAERYLLDDNRFRAWGLMGPGTALAASVVAGSGAALVSTGGVDPHSGRTSSEVRAFDAETGAFLEPGSLQEPRRDHTATRIAVSESQTLLLIGGRDETGAALASMSVYDPVNGIDRPLPSSLRVARAAHTATRLADGNPVGPGAVLVCGGVGQGGEALDSCELVVPPANPLLPSSYDDPAEVPVIDVEGRLAAGRVSHTATLLDTGEVLIVGGGDPAVDQVAADVVVPRATASFIRQTAGQPVLARRGHAAVHLGSGRVLVVGGEAFSGTGVGPTARAELYVHAAGAFLPLPDMNAVRAGPGAVLLADGNVLVVGGARAVPDVPGVPTRSLASSELYLTGPDGTGTFEELPDLPLSYGRADVQAVDVFGRAVLAGGTHRDGALRSGSERRTPITFVDMLQAPADAIQP